MFEKYCQCNTFNLSKSLHVFFLSLPTYLPFTLISDCCVKHSFSLKYINLAKKSHVVYFF